MLERAKYPLAALLVLAAACLILVSLVRSRESGGERLSLAVRVVYLYDGSPVTNAAVEVVSAAGRVVAREPVDARGTVVVRLVPAAYRVRVAAGYAGEKEVVLSRDAVIVLEVLPVNR